MADHWSKEQVIDILATLGIEMKRLRDIANGYAARLGEGPLACRHCGERKDADHHRPLADCLRVVYGVECREPERHHAFEPNEEL